MDSNLVMVLNHSRIGEGSVSSIWRVLETDDRDLLATGLVLLLLLMVLLVLVLVVGLLMLLLLLLMTTIMSGKGTGGSSRRHTMSRRSAEVASGCGLVRRLLSVVWGGQERGSSGGASVGWRGNVGVAQMRRKDTVDHQSEAHKLKKREC